MRRGDLYFSEQCAVEYIVRWSTIGGVGCGADRERPSEIRDLT
jgi:hypothetical protein